MAVLARFMFAVLMTCGFVFSGVSTACAQSVPQQEEGISLQDAKDYALDLMPGKIVNTVVEPDVYEFAIVQEDGTRGEVVVDILSGGAREVKIGKFGKTRQPPEVQVSKDDALRAVSDALKEFMPEARKSVRVSETSVVLYNDIAVHQIIFTLKKNVFEALVDGETGDVLSIELQDDENDLPPSPDQEK